MKGGNQKLIEEREKGMKSTVAAAVFVVILLCAEARGEASFRCGSEVVNVGDTTYAVLQECGAPDLREIRVTEKIYAR
jgi:hypothetical protein